jgi:hypothetical protein
MAEVKFYRDLVSANCIAWLPDGRKMLLAASTVPDRIVWARVVPCGDGPIMREITGYDFIGVPADA